MARVEQNRYKTNNGCIKHLPQTGNSLDLETGPVDRIGEWGGRGGILNTTHTIHLCGHL